MSIFSNYIESSLSLIGVFLTALTAIISVVIGLVSVLIKVYYRKKELLINRNQKEILEDRFSIVIDYLLSLLSYYKSQLDIEYAEDSFPLSELYLLDLKYDRDWLGRSKPIHSVFSENKSTHIKDVNIPSRIKILLKEILWFYDLQSKHLDASIIRIKVWKLIAKYRYIKIITKKEN